jgi:hypothetical protein
MSMLTYVVVSWAFFNVLVAVTFMVGGARRD